MGQFFFKPITCCHFWEVCPKTRKESVDTTNGQDNPHHPRHPDHSRYPDHPDPLKYNHRSQSGEICKFDSLCDRASCSYVHTTTIDGKSPIREWCSFSRSCTKKSCAFRHPTFHGHSPTLSVQDFCLERIPIRLSALPSPSSRPKEIRVVSWNLLACPLFEKMKESHPETYGTITNETRWNHLLHRLHHMMGTNSILALQEVTWIFYTETLVPLVENMDYSIHYVSYGNDFNGRMGVAILFPHILYTDVHHYAFRVGLACAPGTPGRCLPNQALCMVLQQQSTKALFGVVVYHMPCKPKHPDIQKDHWDAIKSFVDSTDVPVIIAADMNMYPEQVNLSLPNSGTQLTSIWNKTQIVPTTRSLIHTDEFQGCIDFIFTSSSSCKKEEKRCKRESESESEWEWKWKWKESGVENKDADACSHSILPSNDHPSDHIPIHAVLSLSRSLYLEL